MQHRPFKELFSIPLRNGLTKPKAVRGAGTKMVNMGELFANPRIVNVAMDRVPLNQTERDSSLLAEGDLLFARQSLVFSGAGKCSIFVCDEDDVCFESHVIRCRLNQELADPYFYYYFFSSPAGRTLMESIVEQGAGASGIRGSDLAGLSVPWINLAVQRHVAGALSQIDNKIDLNRRINQTLEAMAQALFKSWFVNFDPVKAKVAAKAEGRDPLRAAMSAISGKLDAELDALPPEAFDQLAATAALFPDEMEESALGEIPRGWSAKKFGDFIDRISVGKKFDQKTAFSRGAVPILDQGKSGVIGFHNEIPGVLASHEQPVVVFSNHTCYMRLITFDFSAIQNVLPFIGKGVDTVWAYYATKDTVQFSEYKGHWPDFVLANAVVPKSDLTLHFRKILQPLISQIRVLELESEKLSTLRDTLLPKLLSGELSVDALNDEVAHAL